MKSKVLLILLVFAGVITGCSDIKTYPLVPSSALVKGKKVLYYDIDKFSSFVLKELQKGDKVNARTFLRDPQLLIFWKSDDQDSLQFSSEAEPSEVSEAYYTTVNLGDSRKGIFLARDENFNYVPQEFVMQVASVGKLGKSGLSTEVAVSADLFFNILEDLQNDKTEWKVIISPSAKATKSVADTIKLQDFDLQRIRRKGSFKAKLINPKAAVIGIRYNRECTNAKCKVDGTFSI